MSLCTMFQFQGVDDPNLLHCTHKYFNDEAGVSREQVIAVLRDYFAKSPFQSFFVPFTKLDSNFGDGSYRVVEPETKERFLLDLKAQLDLLFPDKFPDYRPHVTVGRNTDTIEKTIVDYVLMDDHVLVWSARNHFSEIEAEVRSRFSFKKK